VPEDRAGEHADDWQQRRRDAALEHAATLERRRAAETAAARRLVEDFVAEARSRGLRTRSLLARSHDGRARYRTGLTGWYLKLNGSLAVSEQGDFYIMSAGSSLRARITGTTLTPADPPLAVGVGARDGESMPLQELLTLRLEAGDDWPAPS
jgi:hypothetical protein